MKGKAGRTQNWLPNQVAWGIDCTDPDPEKWTKFGDLDDKDEASTPAQKLPRGHETSK